MAKLPRVIEGPVLNDDLERPEDQLRKAMNRAGIIPPSSIYIDGQIHRFSTSQKTRDDAGWYVAFNDNIVAGAFGDWRTDQVHKFVYDLGRKLSSSEEMQIALRVDEARRAREAARELAKEQAAETVTMIWSQSAGAEGSHEYLTRKGIGVHGARVTGDGRLILPMYGPDGELTSLQYISGDGEKRYHSGGAVKGSYNIIGSPYESDIIYIAEGHATAATVHESTGLPCVVAYSANNLPTVTEIIRDKFVNKKIVIVADNDKSGTGENYANQAAAKSGAIVILPPIEGDVNDYRAQGGDVKSLLTETQSPLAFYFADTLPNEYTPPDEIIEGLVTSNSVNILYGDSNSGKTFFALSLAGAVAEGHDIYDRKTEHGVVVYLATEAPENIKTRIQAMRKEYGRQYQNIAVIPSPVDLHESERDTLYIIEAIKEIEKRRGKIVMVVADTLARIANGANENSGEDMGPVMRRFDRIKDATGAAIMIIHHTGKEAVRGARGWSGIRAHVDTELELLEDSGVHVCKITKQRALPGKGDEIFFALRVVEMGVTKFGKPATTCVVEMTDERPADKKKEKKTDEKLSVQVKTFIAAWVNSGCEFVDDNPYITGAALRKYMVDIAGKSHGTAKIESAPAGGRMVTKLIEARKIRQNEHGFLVIDDEMASIMALKKPKNT